MNNESSYIEEDEIDLRELFATIVKGKYIILSIVSIVLILTLMYVLKLPNVYKSEAVLIPTETKGVSLGGLGGLAAMAGVSLGSGGGSMTPDVAFNALLNNYNFMVKFVTKNKLLAHYNDENIDKNYVFALGYRGLYDLLKKNKTEKNSDKAQEVFDIVKMLQQHMSIGSDKKTGLITVAYSDSDRHYPPLIIEDFLSDASEYLVENNLRIIDRKLGYFQKELLKAESFELRQNLSTMISKILQEKVMMKSKRYYQCDVLTQAEPAYIKDKTKPKRALILVVSFITSIILGIFLVFFLEFIKSTKEENLTQ